VDARGNASAVWRDGRNDALDIYAAYRGVGGVTLVWEEQNERTYALFSAHRTETGDWLAVTLADGKKGWVAASLVKLDVPVSGIAVAQNLPKAPTPAATSKPAAPRATLTIDEQIAAVAKGTHGALPQSGDMGGVSAGGEAEVIIVNDTPNVLTVLVGSPSSTSITIEACSSCKHYSLAGPSSCQEEGRSKRTIRLKPGSSQVAARADDRSVTAFLGTWELRPDTAYFNCFFIVVG